MLIKGSLAPPQEVLTITLPRSNGEPLTLKVGGMPLGVRLDYATVWPEPMMPFTVMRKVNGDEEKKYDSSNPEWRKEAALQQYHSTIYTVYRALVAGGDVTFSTTPTNRESMLALANEMKPVFSEGDIAIILRGVNDASHVDNKVIKEAAAGF